MSDIPEIIRDEFIVEDAWKIGSKIDGGSFGNVYLASNILSEPVTENTKYVIKLEAGKTCLLIAEYWVYYRLWNKKFLNNWKNIKGNKNIGIPIMYGFGYQYCENGRINFLVLERFPQTLKTYMGSLPFEYDFVCKVSIRLIEILEYLHFCGYVHGDIKSSNILLDEENNPILGDMGCAALYLNGQTHIDYNYGIEEPVGTALFMSRDGHRGILSRRSDIESLLYNVLMWITKKLPWDNLSDDKQIQTKKSVMLKDISLFMDCCSSANVFDIPEGIRDFAAYVAAMKFTETPDYRKLEGFMQSSEISFQKRVA